MSALRELLILFGVEVDDKKLDTSAQKMRGLADVAMKAAATIGVAFGLHEISEFIRSQIELGTQTVHTADMLGLTVRELKEFNYAAANAGLGADEADNALRFLNRNMGEAVKGGGAAGETFARLGVELKDATGEVRPTGEVLGDIAEGFTKLKSPAEKTAAAMTIFGRAGARMIPLLNKGRKNIEELSAEFAELTGGALDPSIEMLEEGEHQLVRLSTAARGLKGVIAAELIPPFSAFVSWVVDGMKAFRQFASHSYIVQTALATLAAISVVLAGIWAVMNVEVLMVVAAIALLILVVDDIYTAFRGGKSVIGEFIDALFGIGTTQVVFDNLRSWAEDAYDVILKIARGIKVAIVGVQDFGNELRHRIVDAMGGSRAEDERYAKRSDEIAGKRTAAIDAFDEVDRRNDRTGEGPAIRPRKDVPFTMMLGVPQMPAVVTAPGASHTVQHGDVTKHNEVNVTVHGGGANADTGKVVRDAVLSAIRDDDNQAAYAALPGGGGH